ncbi:hypothetical protein GCM10027589_35770 [Actinocorallia lasiicapitis]
MDSPEITHLSWGRLEAAGLPPAKDLVLYPGGGHSWDWAVHGTRHSPGITPAEVQALLDLGAETVVLSKGMDEVLQTMPETFALLEDAEVPFHHLETRAAVALYNSLIATTRVGGLFHSTC